MELKKKGTKMSCLKFLNLEGDENREEIIYQKSLFHLSLEVEG